MSEPRGRRTGRALAWRAAEMLGERGIFLVRLLVLTRLLAPEDFGLLAIAMSALGLTLAVTEFGMSSALVQRSRIEEQHYDVAWTVGVVRALFVGGLLFMAAGPVAQAFGDPRAVDIVRGVAILPVVDALASVRTVDLNRALHFRSLAGLGLSRALVNAGVAIALASALGVWALVLASLAGAAVASMLSYRVAPYRPRIRWDRGAFAPLMRFGRWVFLTGVLSRAGAAGVGLVIARNLGTDALGLYYLAASIAFLPSEVASQVAGAVAFPVFSRLKGHQRQLAAAFRNFLRGTFLILGPPVVLLILLAPAVVDVAFDARWAGAALVVSFLAAAGLLGLFGDTTVPLFMGVGLPQRVAAIEALQSIAILAPLWLLTREFGLQGVGVAFLLSAVLSQALSVHFLRALIPEPFRGSGRWLPAVGTAGLAAGSAALAVGLAWGGMLGLITSGLVGAALAALILWGWDRTTSLGITDSLVEAFPQLGRLGGIRRVRAP